MNNNFFEFYGEKNISPVKQDISNIEIHYARRKKLYRQLGLPIIAFRDKQILEVGPGGGYNTLAFFHWNANHIDLVEYNKKGIEDMNELFNSQHIPPNKYTIYQTMIESYQTKKNYDIIIAESFLQFLPNQKDIINKLKSLAASNGIIVVTCSDDICFFIEQMKRLIAHAISKDITDYQKKVTYLAKIFKKQLKTLRGVSRSAEDWVQDQLLNPAGANENSLSVWDAIHLFGDDYDVLGASPNMFTDYSWYKDIWYDYKKDFYKQFEEKNCTLILANMEEKKLNLEQNKYLKKQMKEIKADSIQYENSFDYKYIEKIISRIFTIKEELALLDENLEIIISEILEILEQLKFNTLIQFDKYPHFFSAFGRTQQYLSMVKK